MIRRKYEWVYINDVRFITHFFQKSYFFPFFSQVNLVYIKDRLTLSKRPHRKPWVPRIKGFKSPKLLVYFPLKLVPRPPAPTQSEVIWRPHLFFPFASQFQALIQFLKVELVNVSPKICMNEQIPAFLSSIPSQGDATAKWLTPCLARCRQISTLPWP